MSGILVVVRHGQSRFNKLNIFTGWLDAPLSEQGIKEAHSVARHCEKFDYDVAFTSSLKRAHETLSVILSKQNKIGVFVHEAGGHYNIPDDLDPKLAKKILRVYASEALNERAYGALQGMDKQKAIKTYGEPQVQKWRRGFSDRPSGGESLKDVYERIVPYFEKMIMPGLSRGKTILTVSHGNTLRALVKYLENIDDDKISFVELPLGYPLVYEFSGGQAKRTEGEYMVI